MYYYIQLDACSFKNEIYEMRPATTDRNHTTDAGYTVACPPVALSSLVPSGLVSLPSIYSQYVLFNTYTTKDYSARETRGKKFKNSEGIHLREVLTSEGHTQFRRQRFCPLAPGQIPQSEWLQKATQARETGGTLYIYTPF